ncbi:unnamed protein product [Ectocarpus sp. 12 AP-2014]
MRPIASSRLRVRQPLCSTHVHSSNAVDAGRGGIFSANILASQKQLTAYFVFVCFFGVPCVVKFFNLQQSFQLQTKPTYLVRATKPKGQPVKESSSQESGSSCPPQPPFPPKKETHNTKGK